MTELAKAARHIDWQAVKDRLTRDVIGTYSEADLERIFRERAVALALPLQSGKEKLAATHLTCRVGSLKVLLPLTHTLRILRPGWMASVPSARPELSRIVHVEGRIVAVVDLARLFEVTAKAEGGRGLLVLLGAAGERVAVAVDSAHGLTHVDAGALGSASGHEVKSSDFVLGLGPKLELVIDAARLIAGLEKNPSSSHP